MVFTNYLGLRHQMEEFLAYLKKMKGKILKFDLLTLLKNKDSVKIVTNCFNK